MSKSPVKRDPAPLPNHLIHIVKSSDAICEYLKCIDYDAFLNNREKQDAVILRLSVIGEASHNILKHYPEFADRHQELPLKLAYAMRNRLVHNCEAVDLNIVWNAAQDYLPEFRALAATALEEVLSQRIVDSDEPGVFGNQAPAVAGRPDALTLDKHPVGGGSGLNVALQVAQHGCPKPKAETPAHANTAEAPDIPGVS